MRYFTICGAMVVAATLIDARSTAVAADWCLIDIEGVVNCSFTSFEQCLASRSGVGGHCTRNSGNAWFGEQSAPAKSDSKSTPAKKKKQAQ